MLQLTDNELIDLIASVEVHTTKEYGQRVVFPTMPDKGVDYFEELWALADRRGLISYIIQRVKNDIAAKEEMVDELKIKMGIG